MSKNSLVKNRAPAPIQITAEQILREAQDRKVDDTTRPERRRITDTEELAEYQMSKRKEFEDEIRRQRHHLGTWVKYALWEESQKEFKRARSVFERALDVDYKSQSTWLKYAEMEMKNKFINHARNVWDRAVTLLPRVSQFWYKYAYMEEMVGNVNGARQVFERWMQWEPDEQAWFSYIKLEMRCQNIEGTRSIFERFLVCHPIEKSYIKYAKWEEKQQQPALARKIYERCMEELRDDERSEKIYIEFSFFEERLHEYERARAIFQFALDQIPKEEAKELYKAFINFEKQHGDRKDIEDGIITKRRFQYEQQLKENASDYEVWFDYIRLEEAEGSSEMVREVYERAIANIPPLAEKRYWQRYIYLWIYYALNEELEQDDTDRTRQIYQECLKIIPHETFTFSKIWILYAQFEIRQRDIVKARKILGNALGRCPRDKLYRFYISLELQLGEVERCRKLSEKYLEFNPNNCLTWTKFAELEKNVGEYERARAIYELAIQQEVLDMPEVLWKAYIDFEIEQEEFENTRALYERLLERTKHVKVWISFAKFEANQAMIEEARDIFERSYAYLKSEQKGEERLMLLEAWKDFEQGIGPENDSNLKKVMDMMPRRVTKTRMVYSDDGTELGDEEYIDYLFPDDAKSQVNLKLLQAAHSWKKRAREE